MSVWTLIDIVQTLAMQTQCIVILKPLMLYISELFSSFIYGSRDANVTQFWVDFSFYAIHSLSFHLHVKTY